MTAEVRMAYHSMKDLSDAIGRAAKLTFANKVLARQGLSSIREHLDDSTCGQCELVSEGEGSTQDIEDQEAISGFLESLDELILEFE